MRRRNGAERGLGLERLPRSYGRLTTGSRPIGPMPSAATIFRGGEQKNHRSARTYFYRSHTAQAVREERNGRSN